MPTITLRDGTTLNERATRELMAQTGLDAERIKWGLDIMIAACFDGVTTEWVREHIAYIDGTHEWDGETKLATQAYPDDPLLDLDVALALYGAGDIADEDEYRLTLAEEDRRRADHALTLAEEDRRQADHALKRERVRQNLCTDCGVAPIAERSRGSDSPLCDDCIAHHERRTTPRD